MKRLTIVLMLLMAALTIGAPNTNAQPSWIHRHWKSTVGTLIIVGATVADAKTTCDAFHRGAIETAPWDRGGTSCKDIVLGEVAANGFYTGMRILAHHVDRNKTSKPWILFRDWSIPVGVSAIHATFAYRNTSTH